MDSPEKIASDITQMYLNENGGRPLSFFKRMKLKKEIKEAVFKNHGIVLKSVEGLSNAYKG